MFLSGISGEGFTFKLAQIVSRILFNMVVGPKVLLPLWLSAQTHFQFLEAIPIPHHVAPSILKPKWEDLSLIKYLSFLEISPTRKSSVPFSVHLIVSVQTKVISFTLESTYLGT